MRHSAIGCIAADMLWFLAAPPETDAQPLAKVATIGYLQVRGAPGSGPFTEAFRQWLHDLGYVEGKTIVISYRSAEGDLERLPALAAELVRLPVDVIFAASGQVAEAVKDATTTVPIVMVSGADPVAIGLVASLARPGGNMTGLTLMNAELAGKQLQLLRRRPAAWGASL
jgi:putative ABC transport system substrate-binding protein